MTWNTTKFDIHHFDEVPFDGWITPASPIMSDTTDEHLEESWQVKLFGRHLW